MKDEDLDFQDATRAATFARICLTGVSGSGKTYTGLLFAHGLGKRIAVIDSERRTASKYAGRNGWKFQQISPTSFSPQSLVKHLAKAAAAGFDVVMIDSWSHYWNGADGMLEQVDRITASGRNNNKFATGWKEMGPEERRMIDAILSYPGHVIATLRVKTEYVVEARDGKHAPTKVGTKPVQRDGFEYEFDLIGDMDLQANLTVTKSRVEGIEAGMVYPKPGMGLAAEILEFVSDGTAMPSLADYRQRALQAPDPMALKALFEEATANQVAGAPMIDDNGRPTVLGDYLRELAGVMLSTQKARAREQQEPQTAGIA